MWPRPRAPISTSRTSVPAGAPSSVRGTPSSLLKDSSLAPPAGRVPIVAAVRSLTVVLPTDPVTPIDRIAKVVTGRPAEVEQRPPRCRARPPRSPRRLAPSAGALDHRYAVRAGRRPRQRRTSCPSRSATIGTNSWPGSIARESIAAPSTSTSGPMRRPPVAAAISSVRSASAESVRRPPYTRRSVGRRPHPARRAVRRPLGRARGVVRRRPCTCCGPPTPPATTSCPSASPATAGGSTPARPSPPSVPGAGAAALPDPERVRGRRSTRCRRSPPRSTGEQVVVLPLLHGPMGEDGTVQGLLELAGVPYVGAGVLGSALSMDKAVGQGAADRPRPARGPWIAAAGERDRRHAGRPGRRPSSSWPVFVKPANLGSSVGVTKAGGPGAFDGRHRRGPALRRVRHDRGGDQPAARSRWRCSATPTRRRRCRARSCPAASSTTTRTSTSTAAAQLRIPAPLPSAT